MNQCLKIHATSLLMLSYAVSSASAQDNERWPRWYLGLHGTLGFLDDSDIRGSSSGKLAYDSTGAGVGGSIGYMPPAINGFRMEGEVAYHYIGLNRYRIGATSADAHGRSAALSYMGNLFYDFNNASQWTPYVGAGAGGASVQLARSSGLGNTSESDRVFAYQFMGGLSFAPQSIPLTEWNLGYRYFATQDPEFQTSGGSVQLKDYNSHNVEIGAKFRF